MEVSGEVGEKQRKWRHEIFKILKEFGYEEEKMHREVTSEDYGGFANCYTLMGEI